MQAWGQKLRGMCLEAQNDQARALSCYEKALALDPKIGLKRRAD
jgi:tetratricopeptide (TPR) repeat protein